jgi:hypothetical protein
MFYGAHNTSVDLWLVRYLIKNNSQDSQLIQYSEKLMAYNPSERPTVKQTYSWLWNNFKDNLEKNFSCESSMNEDIIQ